MCHFKMESTLHIRLFTLRPAGLLLRAVMLVAMLAALLTAKADNERPGSNRLGLTDASYARYLRCLDARYHDDLDAYVDTFVAMSAESERDAVRCLAMVLRSDNSRMSTEQADRMSDELLTIDPSRMTDGCILLYHWLCFGLCHSYLEHMMFANALTEAERLQERALASGDKRSIAYFYNLMGEIYQHQRVPQMAKASYLKGLAYVQANLPGDQYMRSMFTDNLGYTYYAMHQYDSAAICVNRALEIAPPDAGRFVPYLHLISIYAAKGDIAMMNLAKANVGKLQSHVRWIVSDEYYHAMIAYNVAHGNYAESLSLCDSLSSPSRYGYRSSISARFGNYEEAYRDLRIYTDSIYRMYAGIITSSTIRMTNRIDRMEIENERRSLALQAANVKLEALEAERSHEQNLREKNSLQLMTAELNLKNQELMLRQQSAEIEKANLESARQQNMLGAEIEQSRRRVARVTMLVAVMLVVVCILVAYNFERRRSLRRLQNEKLLAQRAQREAEQAQREAEEARRQAEQANNMQALFLQNMSHEIRTPLNAIVGFSDILNSTEDFGLTPEERANMLQLIHANTGMLTTLINDILDISKMESGNYTLVIAPVQVCTLCRSVLMTVDPRVPEGVELRLAEPDNTEYIIINTDSSRLQQVLVNFLTNACKHTTKGSITLAYEPLGTGLRFSVTDTGTGIPVDKADKVFDRFQKLDNFKQGTGLGLNICKRIAESVGGRVYVDTSYTHGARLVFEHPNLPLDR